MRADVEEVRRAEASERRRALRREQTGAERVLWEALRDRRLEGLKFRRQVAMDIYVLDFYCRDLKLVVELDGGIHAEPRQAAHDQNRNDYLRSLGCTVLRFPNEAISNALPSVIQTITGTAASLKRTSSVSSSCLPSPGEGRGELGEGRG
jgi:very-short-patch-repair endonuclease